MEVETTEGTGAYLNYLDEIIPELTTPDEDITPRSDTFKSKFELNRQSINPASNIIKYKDPEPVNNNITQNIKVPVDKLAITTKDYDFKIAKSNKQNFNSLAHEKKVKNLFVAKEILLKKLKSKRNENEILKKMKSEITSKVTKSKAKKQVKHNDLAMRKINIKLDSRHKRVIERALKVKKIKKQEKKKTKAVEIFLHYNNYGVIPTSRFIKHMDITDWRVFIEKQMADILDSRLVDLDHFSKSLMWEMEKIENVVVKSEKMENMEIKEIELENLDETPLSRKTHHFSRKNNLNNEINKVKETNQEKETKWKKNKKKEKLDLLKEELENLKKEGSEVQLTKDAFTSTLQNLEQFRNESNKEVKNTIFPDRQNLEVIKEEDDDKKSEFEGRPKLIELKKQDKLQIKQRMITFKMKVFDKLDLKKIMTFWIENKASLKVKKMERTVSKKEEVKSTKDKEEKKIDKAETNVKYEYKKPDKELLKIIPFCNNIFSIQKFDN